MTRATNSNKALFGDIVTLWHTQKNRFTVRDGLVKGKITKNHQAICRTRQNNPFSARDGLEKDKITNNIKPFVVYTSTAMSLQLQDVAGLKIYCIIHVTQVHPCLTVIARMSLIAGATAMEAGSVEHVTAFVRTGAVRATVPQTSDSVGVVVTDW